MRTLTLWLPDELLGTDDAAAIKSRSLLARALVWSTGGRWEDLIEALFVRSMPLRRLDGYVTSSAGAVESRLLTFAYLQFKREADAREGLRRGPRGSFRTRVRVGPAGAETAVLPTSMGGLAIVPDTTAVVWRLEVPDGRFDMADGSLRRRFATLLLRGSGVSCWS